MPWLDQPNKGGTDTCICLLSLQVCELPESSEVDTAVEELDNKGLCEHLQELGNGVQQTLIALSDALRRRLVVCLHSHPDTNTGGISFQRGYRCQ